METRMKKYREKRRKLKRESIRTDYLKRIFDEMTGNPLDKLDEMMEDIYEQRRKSRV